MSPVYTQAPAYEYRGEGVNMTNHFDILIAGGGLIGNSLVCALQGLPLRIGLIDNKPSTDARTIALTYGSRMIFSKLGIWEELSAHVTAMKHIHVSERG